MVRIEYARDRQRRVVVIGLVAVAVNIVLDFVLVGPFREHGLAVATTVATAVNALLLALGLGLWNCVSVRHQLLLPATRVFLCGGVMAGVVSGTVAFAGGDAVADDACGPGLELADLSVLVGVRRDGHGDWELWFGDQVPGASRRP